MKFFGCLLILLAFFIGVNSSPLVKPIGKSDFTDWKSVSKVIGSEALLGATDSLCYTYPDGNKYYKGFRVIDEGVSNWFEYYGIRFSVFLENELVNNVDVILEVPDYQKENLQPYTKASVKISGKGWHEVIIPWKNFSIAEGQRQANLQSVKKLTIKLGGHKSAARIKDVVLVKGNEVAFECNIRGKSANKGGIASYNLVISNPTSITKSISLIADKKGWESMSVTIDTSSFDLKPLESKTVTVRVVVSERVPAGSRETQTIRAVVNGKPADDAEIQLVTTCYLPSPNVLHTTERWNEVREKVKNYAWAKVEQEKYIALAEKWKVPELATSLSGDNDDKGMHLFKTMEEHNLMAAAISYQLTGQKKYAEKVALFIRKLSNPSNGYPTTFRACHQSFVQEGHFFQHIAMAYDMVLNANVFTEEDVSNIEHTFREYINTVDLGMHNGGINNWVLSEITGALYCALALQDWSLVEQIFYGSCGIVDHLSHGVMNDGWWYECSVGYNVWCSSEFSQVALALEPWGINFKDMKVPAGTTKYYSLMPGFKDTGKYGINFNKWGPVVKNSVGIKDMWDALPSFADYRGVMFGVNDAQETMLAGQSYELAYYLYRDPAYASIVSRGDTRDLLYGVPELPHSSSPLVERSAYADNIGIAMLRANKENAPIRNQIQAALHYGTHGGYHGHFDRTNFLHMSRYGRSFFNPEMIWYGYPSHMYKFYVQTSMSKNMVVVDQKMQEAIESYRTLFHTGKMMQATVVETNSRWSNPPYGGMQYDYLYGIPFKEKAWLEGRSVPAPVVVPKYGELTGYTEPIFQRRAMVVTADYVVLADYNKAQNERTFDWLFQAKGFQEITADKKSFLRHTSQMNYDSIGSAQFITDCNWWAASGSSTTSFITCWGKDCDQEGNRAPYSDTGELKINVYNAWPIKKEIMIGTAPEDLGNNKQVYYSIKADGKTLKNDSTGAWILGTANIDLVVKGTKELRIEIKSIQSKKPSLFIGNAKLILSNGKEVWLKDLPYTSSNVLPTPQPNTDYFGGPVKIGGDEMNALPAMPSDIAKNAVLTFDISKIAAVKLKAVIGSDFPLGNETARRKTLAVRVKDKEAVYLTVIEPFEKNSVIKKVKASLSNSISVELLDGRIQEFTFNNLDAEGKKVEVKMIEKNGAERTEEIAL
jgi:hypothetical protein